MRTRRLTDSFRYAVEGLVYSLRTQRNMRVHLAVALVVLTVAITLDLSKMEVTVLVLAIVAVISAEMVNTAIEAAVDLTTGSYHPLARIAKNVAAGAVLVTSLGAVFVGFLAFSDEVATFPARLGFRARAPVLVVPLMVGLVLLLALGAKALMGTLPWKAVRGITPSGSTALAFCACVWIVLRTGDGMVSALALLSAVLVAYSRVDGGRRTVAEAFLGALLGAVACLLVYCLAI